MSSGAAKFSARKRLSRLTVYLGFGDIARTLGQADFRVYITGNAASLIGTWMQRIAVGWLTWEMTGSGFWLGVVSCADLLPTVIVGPIGGVLADRFDRRRIMMTTQTAAACLAAVLCALTATGLIDIRLLALLVLLNGIVTGFTQPARLALVPSLVPRAYLSTGIAVNSVVFNLARFVGPALAGLVIVAGGIAAAFGVNALSFLAFLFALWRLRGAGAPERAAKTEGWSILSQLREGFAYTVRHPGIGPMLLLLSLASLCARPFVELMPGFAADVFGGGADTLALLSSSIGVGAVMSGVWFARHRPSGGRTRVVFLNTLLLVLAVAVFVATDSLWIAVPGVALAGMAMVASGVNMQVLMQLSVDGAMRGRVLSLYGVIFAGGPAAGALIMGALSEALGLRLPLAGGVALLLLIWLWMWRRRDTIAQALEPDTLRVPVTHA